MATPKEQKTIHGGRRQRWYQVHDDYKSIINGVKYVLVMDESGATISIPYKEARERKLV